jgi:hypothetical protein
LYAAHIEADLGGKVTVHEESIVYFSKNAKSFGIDRKHIGIYSSGHSVPPALVAALEKSKKFHKYIQCAVFRSAVLQYGYSGLSYDKSEGGVISRK